MALWERTSSVPDEVITFTPLEFTDTEQFFAHLDLTGLLRTVHSTLTSTFGTGNKEVLLDVARKIYTPVPVNISLLEDPTATPSDDDAVVDMWSTLYMATVTRRQDEVVALLKLHALIGAKIIRILTLESPLVAPLLRQDDNAAQHEFRSPAVLCVGDDARALLLDSRVASDDMIKSVTTFVIPFLKQLLKSSGPSSPQHEAAVSFVRAIHESSDIAATPSRNTTLKVVAGETCQLTGQRYRTQLFVDAASLYESVCANGDSKLLGQLSRDLPIAPVFLVRLDLRCDNEGERIESASFDVSYQEATKLAFYLQCFPELPSPVATLRKSASFHRQRASILSLSTAAHSQQLASESSKFAVTLMHFRLLRRLVSLSYSVENFSEYLTVLARELENLPCIMPFSLPALFGMCAEFALKPDIGLPQVVVDKLALLMNEDKALIDFFLDTSQSDGERFVELWVTESMLYGPKKFKNRVEMMSFAVLLYLQVTPGPGKEKIVSDGQSLWAAVWLRLFSALSSAMASRLGDEERERTTTDDEIVEALKQTTHMLSHVGHDEDECSSPLAGSSMSLAEKFESAEKLFSGVASKQSNEVKLRFYGLYKQATVGDVNISRPWAMDVAGRAKFDAWASRKGMSQEDAMRAYVEQWLLLKR